MRETKPKRISSVVKVCCIWKAACCPSCVSSVANKNQMSVSYVFPVKHVLLQESLSLFDPFADPNDQNHNRNNIWYSVRARQSVSQILYQ